VAFVIVSTGHLTDSRLHTLPTRTVLAIAGAALLLVMAACTGLGYHLARGPAPASDTAAAGAERTEVRTLTEHVGSLTARLSRLEHEAATLASRLGVVPTTIALSRSPQPESSGGPMIPFSRLTEVDAGLDLLEGALAELSSVAIDRELTTMAFPSRLPVAGSSIPVSSDFGARHDPFTGRLARHTGLDIPARHGTPVLASGGGRVVSAGYKGAYGRTVVIDHGDGLATLYGHASRLLVRTGDVVMPQQPIALVGSTGRSTGPHLHFEVIRAGRRVEPRQYLSNVLDRSQENATP